MSRIEGAVQTKENNALPMLAIILAVFMAVLDTSIVNVAIPKMMAVFGVNQNEIQWVITSYALVVGALIPVTGYMGDRFGYKRTFLYALVLFTLGSALCASAWSNTSMIIFRIIQAVGGGALMPVSMAMIFRMFPPERRGMAMGLFGISIMFAPATGPTLSGYITEYLDWRLIFSINVPIGIIDFFLAAAALKEYKSDIRQPFDLAGFLTSTVGLATLLYGVGIVPDKGWSDPEVIGFISFGAACLIAFVIIELSVKHPMLDLSLLANVTFTLSLIVSRISMMILMGTLFLLPVFLQNLSGLSAIQTGLILLPQALTAGVMMPIAGFLFDKIGVRILAIVGTLVTAYSLYLNHRIDVTTSFGVIIPWLVIRAVGMGFIMMPVQTAGMNVVPMHKIGQGTALSNTIRQVAASFGIAWITLMFSRLTTTHYADNAGRLDMLSVSVTENVNQIQGQYEALGQSAEQAYSSAIQHVIGKVQLKSVVQAMDDVFLILAGLSLIATVFSIFLKGHKAGQGAEKAHVMGE